MRAAGQLLRLKSFPQQPACHELLMVHLSSVPSIQRMQQPASQLLFHKVFRIGVSASIVFDTRKVFIISEKYVWRCQIRKASLSVCTYFEILYNRYHFVMDSMVHRISTHSVGCWGTLVRLVAQSETLGQHAHGLVSGCTHQQSFSASDWLSASDSSTLKHCTRTCTTVSHSTGTACAQDQDTVRQCVLSTLGAAHQLCINLCDVGGGLQLCLSQQSGQC